MVVDWHWVISDVLVDTHCTSEAIHVGFFAEIKGQVILSGVVFALYK